MRITDVDILALSEELEFGGELTDATVELVNRIMFGFGNVPEPQGDIILVCGNSTCVDDRAVKGVEIWKNNPSAYILLTGGAPDANGLTEAERMRRYCLDHGVPADRILMETESGTTNENIIFSAPLVHQFGGAAPRIIAVSSATHLRRVLMNFAKHRALYPARSTVIPCQSIHPSCPPDSWQNDRKCRIRICRELGLIYKYFYQREYPGFEF